MVWPLLAAGGIGVIGTALGGFLGSQGKKGDTITTTSNRSTTTSTSSNTVMPYAYYQPTVTYSPANSSVYSPQYILNSPYASMSGSPQATAQAYPTVTPTYTQPLQLTTNQTPSQSGGGGSLSFDSGSLVIIAIIAAVGIVGYGLVSKK